MASEMRIKDGDEDDDKPEDFADAASTQPPSSAEPERKHDDKPASVKDEGEEHAADGAGLGIVGAGGNIQSTMAKDNEEHVSKSQDSAQMPTIEDSDESAVQTDGATSQPAHSRLTTLDDTPDLPPPTSPPSASRDRSVSPGKGSRSQSPVRIMQPPPSTTERAQNLEQKNGNERVPSPREALARKASSGFGALLGRMGSIRKPAKSPPAPRQERRTSERRGTAASAASVDGNGLTNSSQSPKPSLQDQFTHLRRQEEFSVHDANGQAGDEEQTRSERAQSDADSRSPAGLTREGRSSPTSGMKSPPLNPSLPPGTASGISAGPAVEPKEVNWDLWQQLVYEGPAVVARTSGEELNKAITSGIPPAIRGVVWQILAESKNEELENVYRTLKARGTDAERRHAPSRSESTVGVNGTSTDKEGAIASDASSEHSDNSTTANSGVASPPTSISVDSTGPELRAKLLEEKQKREAAALQKLEKAIRRDMGSRTSYSKYTQSAGLQDGLFGVCKAYALFDEGVGYAQGINFIVMPLLFNLDQEEAFTLLVRLMSKYDLRSMFIPEMTGLHLRLYQFERLLEEHEPAVYCHLRRRNVGPQLYATQWFLTLFAYRFPLQLVLRIYDLILSEGLTAILKFGIVLMQRNRDALLEMKDMSHLTNFLKDKLFDVYIDKSPSASSLLDSGFFGSVSGGADKELYRADEMVRDACNIKISDETLAQYTVEWEGNQRTERERGNELETLRTTNIALTNRVKALEERVQQSDTEHVDIAQDLVKCKVENETLHDENEGLKLKVTELQKMVDAQPAEVEEKLKEEMDRIMQRNIEVQNENRAVKEEMDEMEHELVNAKMAHAQTQADYETIKQKWTSLQALLNDKA
ncbi:GTPase-activating GYP5 [Lecanosticta acicola]|uniref:GTPase-activating protein GYP5 n=1 Tax=Lecanosticta acicola TaxID=111012 RepID=A0AAI8Z4U9_9PEZI|nr:GTPase-activating GYP5 [Lecanosticta acicola]